MPALSPLVVFGIEWVLEVRSRWQGGRRGVRRERKKNGRGLRMYYYVKAVKEDAPLGGGDVLVDLGGREQLVDDVALQDFQRLGLQFQIGLVLKKKKGNTRPSRQQSMTIYTITHTKGMGGRGNTTGNRKKKRKRTWILP